MAQKKRKKVRVVWVPVKPSKREGEFIRKLIMENKDLLDKLREYDLKHGKN